MEHTGQQVYGFYDGDFTFHVTEHEDPRYNRIFRVRIDNASPEERALENTRNHNGTPTGPGRHPGGGRCLEACLPPPIPPTARRAHAVAPSAATQRRLARGRPLPRRETAARELSRPVLCVRDFRTRLVCFVQTLPGPTRLTADGLWLTSLMK